MRSVAAVAERLPFADASFDTVVAILVLSSVAEPHAAASELRRVLRPGGRLVVLEHVRSDDQGPARWQDLLASPWAAAGGGCRPNRHTVAILSSNGFDTEGLDHFPLATALPLVRPHIAGTARPR